MSSAVDVEVLRALLERAGCLEVPPELTAVYLDPKQLVALTEAVMTAAMDSTHGQAVEEMQLDFAEDSDTPYQPVPELTTGP